jgi:hypothetical protein
MFYTETVRARFPKMPKSVVDKIMREKKMTYQQYHTRLKRQKDPEFILYVLREYTKYKKMLTRARSQLRKVALDELYSSDDGYKWKGIPDSLLRLPGEEVKGKKSDRLIKPLKLSDL